MSEKQQASVWRDLIEPGWREREAERVAKIFSAVPVRQQSSFVQSDSNTFEPPTITTPQAQPDTNTEREAFETFATACPMGKFDIQRKGDGYWSSHTQLMWDTWQARGALAAPAAQSQTKVLEALRETQEMLNVSQCPWCGHWGQDYRESEKPSDYCHHDYQLHPWRMFAAPQPPKEQP